MLLSFLQLQRVGVYPPAAVCRLLMVVASLIAEQGLTGLVATRHVASLLTRDSTCEAGRFLTTGPPEKFQELQLLAALLHPHFSEEENCRHVNNLPGLVGEAKWELRLRSAAN